MQAHGYHAFFPKTIEEFEQHFGAEEACRQYLFHIRWPSGFQCPVCGEAKAWVNKRNLIVCAHGGHQISLTSGTVMHGTKKPLREWFRAIWWLCTLRTGGSARDLQKLLGLGSYQTAWAWLQKLRRAMILADDEPCEGVVEVGHALIGGADAVISNRALSEDARIIAALEVETGAARKGGRLRMRQIPNFDQDLLLSFVLDNVGFGSRVITTDWQGYSVLGTLGFKHEVTNNLHGGRIGTGETPPRVLGQIARLRQWLLVTHRGAVTCKHLQNYLDEFSFRYNWQGSEYSGKIFHRILQGTARKTAVPYWKLVGRSHPAKPLGGTGTENK